LWALQQFNAYLKIKILRGLTRAARLDYEGTLISYDEQQFLDVNWATIRGNPVDAPLADVDSASGTI
jgi:hypothetical protein